MNIHITKKGLELVIYQLNISEIRLQKRIDNYNVPRDKKQGMQKTLSDIVKERIALQRQLDKALLHPVVEQGADHPGTSYDDIWKSAYPKTNTENENKPIITKVSGETKPNFFQKFLGKLQTSK